MFVEIEQRHLVDHKIDDVINLILQMGYRGFYLKGSERYPIEQFSYERDQQQWLANVYTPQYVANFLFTPIDRDSVLH